MRNFLILVLAFMPQIAAAELWPNVQRLSGSAAATPIDMSDLTQDTFFVIDATSPGFGGLYLPDPSWCTAPRFVGMHKSDNSSNTLQIFALVPSAHLGGYNYLTLPMLGDSIVIGCDTTGYFVVSRSATVKQFFDQHRTAVVGVGQTPYQVKESDRHGIVRVVADTGEGIVNLPTLAHFVIANGYRNTFTIAVERTANSTYNVRVCPPPGKTIDNSAECVTLTQPREIVQFDYDSQEWITINRHP